MQTEMRHRTEDWILDITHEARHLEEQIRGIIARNPLPTLALAIGTGFFGALWLRKKTVMKSGEVH